MNRPAGDLPERRVGLEARAEAGDALRVGAILREQDADVHLVGLALQPPEEAAHPVPDAGPGLAPADPLRFAFENPGFVKITEVPERHVQRDLSLLRVLLEIVLAFLEARGLPRPDRAFLQRFRFVGNDQAEVDAA